MPAANPNCHQVVAPDIAAAAVDAARCPVGEQSAYGACDGGTATMVAGILGGRPAGGKTGSSEQNATETFVGFTPQIAAAGIAANPDNPRDSVGAAVSAAVDAAVARTMAAALQGQPVDPVPGAEPGDRRWAPIPVRCWTLEQATRPVAVPGAGHSARDQAAEAAAAAVPGPRSRRAAGAEPRPVTWTRDWYAGTAVRRAGVAACRRGWTRSGRGSGPRWMRRRPGRCG